MDLKSPTTLAAAWVLAPLLVAGASAGLGAGVRHLSGTDLGALTLPAGFLAGTALISFALELGAGATPTVVLTLVLAICVPAYLVVSRRATLRGRLRTGPGALWRPPPRGVLWAGTCALTTYAIGMAPLVGSGRSGVLGYVLNNDPTIHIALIEALATHGARAVETGADSFQNATTAFEQGYPIGTYAWPLVARVTTGVEPFHLWVPLTAVTATMLALIAYDVIVRLPAPHAFAAAGATLAAVSYLPYSYLAQGGTKELILPVTVLGTAALLMRALDRPALSLGALIPGALAAAAAVATLGYSALVWIGLIVVVALGVLTWRALRGRTGGLWPIALFVGAALPFALPSAIASLSYFDVNGEELRDPAEVGNLVSKIPFEEALGVWLASDYRVGEPDLETPTFVLIALVALAVAGGLFVMVRRRRLAAPLMLFAAIVGAALVYPRVSIYFEAKALVVVAAVLPMLAAAGILGLAQRGGPRAGLVARVAGGLMAAGVLASVAYVYSGIWVTPKGRFEELAQIGKRFSGRGPILINDREYYADYLLRDVRPWNDWGERQPFRGVRTTDRDGRPTPPGFPHAPDFDDYRADYFRRFELLLERKRPGGSLPPSNFEPTFETASYRVWRRTGPDPLMHLGLGLAVLDGSGPLDGAGPVDCTDPAVDELQRRARLEGGRLLVARPQPGLGTAIGADAWFGYERGPLPAPASMVLRRGGFASGSVELEPGTYRAYIQGSFGPGVRLWDETRARGDVLGDLGLPSAWHEIGRIRAAGGAQTLSLTPLDRSLLLAGSRRFDLTGRLVLERDSDRPPPTAVEPADLDRLCGRRIDWIEAVPR